MNKAVNKATGTRLHLIGSTLANTVVKIYEDKFVSKYCHRKLWAGVPSTSPLYHGGGMNLRVRPRVKKVL